MIQLTPSSKILLGIDPIDFRKGIDGICRSLSEGRTGLDHSVLRKVLIVNYTDVRENDATSFF